MPPQTNVASFVLRFMQDRTDTDTDTPPANWRGVVKHVQTNEEKHFTNFADAIDFIAGYVNLGVSFDELGTRRPRTEETQKARKESQKAQKEE